MTKDDRNMNKLQVVNDKINVIESTLQTLNTELLRLHAKRERILNKNKESKEVEMKSDSEIPENAIEIVVKKEINDGEVTSIPEENGSEIVVRKKSRKKWAENNYIIEYNNSVAIVKKKKRKQEETDQTYVFDEEHSPSTSANMEIRKLENEKVSPKSDYSIYSTPQSSIVKLNKSIKKQQWKKDKGNLKDEIRVGILKLDFKGSNIDKIPGYGEIVHF